MMLRKARARLSLAGPYRRSSASYAYEARQDIDIPDESDYTETYGTEYGAGPSRIPYQAPRYPLPSATSSSIERQIPRFPTVISSAGKLTTSTESTGASARRLRAKLRDLAVGYFADDKQLFTGLFPLPPSTTKAAKREMGYTSRKLASLTRLELHTIIHHLIRTRREALALSLVTSTINQTPKRNANISRQTYRKLLLKGHNNVSDMNLFSSVSGVKLRKKSINVISTTLELRCLLDLLQSMQVARLHRPQELYEVIIYRCIAEKHPDKAAKVFVGLVEDWVTEGRVAEGSGELAQGEGHDSEMRSVDGLAAHWWKDVRTWRFPGEVLSPLNRLDLWHPSKHSLGEKMKSFPIPNPTSPPSLVPAPQEELLRTIVKAVRLDPKLASKDDYERSVRALAYLANTILSRTLPISSLGFLLSAINKVPSQPAVYPESFDTRSVPSSDLWAYESFTHIHLAIQSLIFSPPMSRTSAAYLQRIEEAKARGLMAPPPPAVSPYVLPPYAWRTCVQLGKYALLRVRMPEILRYLSSYMRGAFGSTREFNMYKFSSWRPSGPIVSKNTHTAVPSGLQATSEEGPSTHSNGQVSTLTNEESVIAVLAHLAATRQFDQMKSMVYTLIPYLNTAAEPAEDEEGVSLRQSPTPLSPKMYTAILSGLAEAGKTGLAQRVYNQALNAEKIWKEQHDHTYWGSSWDVPVPVSQRLPIDLFTSMLHVWRTELVMANQGPHQWPTGWYPPSGLGTVSRQVGAESAAWETYLAARSRWMAALESRRVLGKDADVLLPNAKFFKMAIQACGSRWKLYESGQLRTRQRDELRLMMDDMASFDVPIPRVLSKKLGHTDPNIDPAIIIAEMHWEGYKSWKSLSRRQAGDEAPEHKGDYEIATDSVVSK